jgi:hypothetical protein
MTAVTKNIIDTYSKLFEGLDSFTKLELIKRLSKSLKKEKASKDKTFREKSLLNAFDSFPADKSAEEIIAEIKASRNFREKDLTL